MTSKISLMLALSMSAVACISSRLKKDTEVAHEIIAEVHATGGRFLYSENQLDVPEDEKHSVVLELDSVRDIQNGSSDRRALASYCAHQLYLRLDPTTIESNHGIEIRFDDETFLVKPHYYSMRDLALANSSIEQAIRYVEFIAEGRESEAQAMFDTAFYGWTSDTLRQLNAVLRSSLTSSIARTENFFVSHNRDKEQSSVRFFPITVASIAVLHDGARVKTEFWFTNVEEVSHMVRVYPSQK